MGIGDEIDNLTWNSSLLKHTLLVGRFGVGLSACLLYSLSKNEESARIVTKRLHNNQSVVADFIMGADGKPTLSQEIEVVLPKFRSGKFLLLNSIHHQYCSLLVRIVCVSMFFRINHCLH